MRPRDSERCSNGAHVWADARDGARCRGYGQQMKTYPKKDEQYRSFGRHRDNLECVQRNASSDSWFLFLRVWLHGFYGYALCEVGSGRSHGWNPFRLSGDVEDEFKHAVDQG